jgi:hypothetical protein
MFWIDTDERARCPSLKLRDGAMNEIWQALAREAGIAAEHMAIGATALGRANYAEQAYYGQAFFALSIGFERAAKLVLVVDHALENQGQFPSHKVLRKHGHKLDGLLNAADEIATRRGLSANEIRLPRTEIHQGITRVLSEFADNITRYYNLDLVTGDPRATEVDDPIKAWSDQVITPILNLHYTPRHQQKHRRNAEFAELVMGPFSVVQYHSEQGKELNSVFDVSLQTGVTEFARPFSRMYVLQIARFLGRLLSELSYASKGLPLEIIPHFGDFFRIFNNEDDYFKSRKTWSIYRL